MNETEQRVACVKALRWLMNNFPYKKDPESEAEKMCNAIFVYVKAAAELLDTRVLTLEEAMLGNTGLDIAPYVWVEIKGREDIFLGYLREPYCTRRLEFNVHETFTVERSYPVSRDYPRTDYMKTIRCWTHKPTEEQREAVKWDD